MSARRHAEPGSQHRGGIVGLADFTGTGGFESGGQGGAHRADQRTASDDFRAVLGNFATGVTIITALDGVDLERVDSERVDSDGTHSDSADATTDSDPAPIGFTCQAFSSLSLDPPLVSFAVSRRSSSRPRILAAGRFCVNVLAFDQRGLCMRFATPGINRFAGVDWWLSPGGSPVLDGSLAWIDCTVEAQYPGGDHAIVIGRVRELSHLRGAAPLVYHRGEFANCFPAAGSGTLPRVS